MSTENKLVQRIVEENEELKTQLKTTQEELEAAQDKLSTEIKLNEGAGKKISEAEEVAATAQAAVASAEAALEKATEELEDLKEVIKTELSGDDVSPDADPADIVREVSEKMHKIIDEYDQLKEINESFGGEVAISEAMDLSGVSADRLKAIFEEYGSAEEMATAIDKGTEALEQVQQDKLVAELNAVGAEYGLTEEQVKALVEKFNIKSGADLQEFFELTNRAKVETETPTVQVGESFSKLLTGRAFNQDQPIDESYQGRFNREKSFGNNSPERAKRLLG